MLIESADLLAYAVPGVIGRINIPFQRVLPFTRHIYNEKLLRLSWGLLEGSERLIPRNPQATPRQASGKPQATPSEHRTNESKIIQLDRRLDEAVTSLGKV